MIEKAATGDRFNRLLKLAVTATFIAVLVAMAGSFGWIRFPGSSLIGFNDVDVNIKLPEAARIVKVDPIDLECKARVYAEVPVYGEREHKIGEWVYRVDRISMVAYGDVDTCVQGDTTQITYNSDGSTEVVIPGEAIEFVRPRVDAVKTAESVTVDKGFAGKLSDVFPWVSDNDNLTPNAYAYAQTVIGSSQCMQEAYEVTEGILLEAYAQQAVRQGADPSKITVRIDGEPEFAESTVHELDGINFQAGEDITCESSGEFN